MTAGNNTPKKILAWYIASDALAAIVAWWLFTWYRRHALQEDNGGVFDLFQNTFFRASIILVPIAWICIFLVTGFYRKSPYLRSRLNELTASFIVCLGGCLLLFFSVILNDNPQSYTYFYASFFLFFFLQWGLTYTGRLIILTRAKAALLSRKVQIRTLLVGNGATALKVFNEVRQKFHSLGYTFAGQIITDTTARNTLSRQLPALGSIANIEDTVAAHNVRQVIIALEQHEDELAPKLLERLGDLDVMIKKYPSTLDILSGSVRAGNVMGTLLIDINMSPMPDWQQNIKQLIDIFMALTALVLLSPLLLFIALRTRLSSPGPIIYRQPRVGYKGRLFTIYKFRSMVRDAEQNGPALSSEDDPRITRWGRIMRKWRLDELPQLVNILKGDMSLVGPRPERQFYIRQVCAVNPYYKYLLKVKPGLTSWGMVQFGYASTVEEMIERMQYDLVYIENISLLLDLKIMIHSVRIIMLGKGM